MSHNHRLPRVSTGWLRCQLAGKIVSPMISVSQHGRPRRCTLTNFCCIPVQFREVFLTPDYLGIAMEYAAGGDMFQHVTNKRGLSEDEARWFFQQLILGLDYCHKMVCMRRTERTLAGAAEQQGRLCCMLASAASYRLC
jgi:Protein kinase domain